MKTKKRTYTTKAKASQKGVLQRRRSVKTGGFTLIELIVVIAIIGILVLLAAPKLLSYTQEAKLAQIKNDAKVAENAVHLYMVENNDQLPAGVTDYSIEDVEAAIGEGRVYDREGAVDQVVLSNYHNITGVDTIKNTKTKLSGAFIANSLGDVYYVHSESLSVEEGTPSEPEVPVIEVAPFIADIGGSGNDSFYSVEQTSNGGFIAAGISNSTDGDMSVLNNKGGVDAILVKFNTSGEVEWMNNIGGSDTDYFISVTQTKDDGFIAVGQTSSNDKDFAGINKGGQDAFLVKFDKDGNNQWMVNLGGSLTDRFMSAKETKEGDFVVVGWTSSASIILNGNVVSNYNNKGSVDSFIIKLNSEGSTQWISSLGGSGVDYFQSVEQTSDGDFVVVGNSSSNDQNFEGSHNGMGDNAIIVKFSSEGEKQWLTNIGGSSGFRFLSIDKTSDGGFIAVGDAYAESILLSEDVLDNYNHKGSSDALIVKFSPEGVAQWVTNIGGSGQDRFHSVKETTDGGFIVAGESNSNDMDFAGMNKGINDGILIKYDLNGEMQWKVNLGGSSNDYFYSVDQTSDGGFVTSGRSYSNDKDFDGLHKGTTSYDDAIIVKFNPDGTLTSK